MKRASSRSSASALLLIGVALLVLPGPGFLLIAAGSRCWRRSSAGPKRPLDYAKDKAQAGIDEVACSTWRASLAVVSALG